MSTIITTQGKVKVKQSLFKLRNLLESPKDYIEVEYEIIIPKIDNHSIEYETTIIMKNQIVQII